jgi:hypothetical protein
MFRPLQGHHQVFLLNHAIKMLRTLLGSQLMFLMFNPLPYVYNVKNSVQLIEDLSDIPFDPSLKLATEYD